jgi:DNA-directed RNA polymerase specialized sigma24 family protein
MDQTTRMESFEEVLLSYVETCYSVALKLTCSPNDARDLTRNVMTWAWERRDTAVGEHDIKGKLLTRLRQTFIENCRNKIAPLARAMA